MDLIGLRNAADPWDQPVPRREGEVVMQIRVAVDVDLEQDGRFPPFVDAGSAGSFAAPAPLPPEAAAEFARGRRLQAAKLAVEIGDVGIADLVRDVGDRPVAVDQQRTGLADAQLGDIA
jgi:hypothetical protein